MENLIQLRFYQLKRNRHNKAQFFFQDIVNKNYLILSALGISNMWLAVFGDVGVTILAVLNCLRLFSKTRGEK